VESDAVVARDLAIEVGIALVAARDELFATYDSEGIKDAGDALAQALIVERLAEHRPADAVLSEEADDDAVRLTAERVWIVDPLDGTREYARAGRVDWAVHVALWSSKAQSITAAALDLPAQGITLDTVGSPLPLPAPSPREGRVRIVVSQSRTPMVLEAIAAVMPVEILLWGSAGAKAARVITGDVDAYVHDTTLNEWDSAAPVGVALAHGLHVSHLDGSPLVFNKVRPISGDLLMCRPELAEQLLAALNASS